LAPLSDQTLAEMLADVAHATPAPGGGSSAAVTCALAAALVEMVAGIESGRAGEAAAAAPRCAALRERALALAERELDAYAPVLEARRLAPDDPGRAQRIQAALVEASGSPLAIAEAAAEVAELGCPLAAASGPSVRGDALAGVLLAEAAAAAAATLVEINLAESGSGSEALERARSARASASAARERAGG
jgi:methenyltetrahydrofolate cyclohydrolase